MYLIVGIDPGINVGYAAIDLDGKLVAAGVEKEANDEEIVRIITKTGIPSLIASDIALPSGFVRKVAARFNVKVHSPKKNMSAEEKREIGENIINPHMRDAYAAAIKAYNTYANRLRQVDKLDGEDKLKLKHLLIQGETLSKMVRGEKPNGKIKNSRTKKRGRTTGRR